MTPTPMTAPQAMIDAAKTLIAECATPEGVREFARVWLNGNERLGRHNPCIGDALAMVMHAFASDIAAGCARSVMEQRRLDARRQRRQSAKQWVRVLAGGRSERRPRAVRPTAHPYLRPLV